jgi:hypothetical protein
VERESPDRSISDADADAKADIVTGPSVGVPDIRKGLPIEGAVEGAYEMVCVFDGA